MLQKGTQVWGGVFDSATLRASQAASPERKVSFYEVELFHMQAGVSHVDGCAYPTRRGMLLCARPGQVRYSDFPVRCSFIRIMPEKDAHRDLCAILDTLPTCTYIEDEETIDTLLSLFSQLSAHCLSASSDFTDEVRINALFYDILYRCLRVCRKEAERSVAEPANRIVQDACEYIREHYKSSDCTLENIAAAVNLSRNRLHTVFKRITGMTPFAYVTQMRIDQAKRLILAGEMTMLDVALETGFCSQSHFSQAFKRATGMTPAAYRNKLLDLY